MWVDLGSWWRRIAKGRAFRNWRRPLRPQPPLPFAAANCFGGGFGDGRGGGGGRPGRRPPTPGRPFGWGSAWCRASTSRPSTTRAEDFRRRRRRRTGPATLAEVATSRWRASRPTAGVAVGGSSSFLLRPDAVAVVAVAGADAAGPCPAVSNHHHRPDFRRLRIPDWEILLPIRTATFAASRRNCFRLIHRHLRRPVERLSSSSCIYSAGSGTKFSPGKHLKKKKIKFLLFFSSFLKF